MEPWLMVKTRNREFERMGDIGIPVFPCIPSQLYPYTHETGMGPGAERPSQGWGQEGSRNGD
jgi:hypothetical protein